MTRFSDVAIRRTWQCASWLLDYPDAIDDVVHAALAETVHSLPDDLGAPLARFLAHRAVTDLAALEASYVATFDGRRRCSLSLTYFTAGDARNRGMAQLRFQQVCRAAGVRLGGRELPDHLTVLLEFGATVDLPAAQRLLGDYRAELESLLLALTDLRSPWADVVEAVSRTMPPLRVDGRHGVRRRAPVGPPSEETELTPLRALALLLAARH